MFQKSKQTKLYWSDNYKQTKKLSKFYGYWNRVFWFSQNVYYNKRKPSIIHYRKFKDFNNDAFIKGLKTLLSKSSNEETIPFQALRESVNVTLVKHAPSKARYTRANQVPYMNKKLSKEIMKRSRSSKKQVSKYQKWPW